MCSAEDTTNDGLAVSLNNHDFTYDTYGNLIEDKNKGITVIAYNHLNLPTKVTFGTRGFIDYIYTADGIKLEKKVTTLEPNTTEVTTSYRDGFQYSNSIDNTNSVLDFFPQAEGTVAVTIDEISGAMSFNYVFHYTDHLGNIRVRYALDPETEGLAILEEKHYYPFGLQHEGYNTGGRKAFKTVNSKVELTPVNPFIGDSFKYGFGGKEYDDSMDINTYDFGARNYDPALGRWMNIDPLAEQMRRHSPYNFGFDNPVFWTDPDGMAPSTELFNLNGVKIGEDENGKDGNVSIISDSDKARSIHKSYKKLLKEKSGGSLASQTDVESGYQTTTTVLKEIMNVLKRTVKNGGDDEESSIVTPTGEISRSKASTSKKDGVSRSETPEASDSDSENTLIHSHPLNGEVNARGNIDSFSALIVGPDDPATFANFKTNVIVGRLGLHTGTIINDKTVLDKKQPGFGAAFFGSNVTTKSKPILTLNLESVENIVNNK